jgi:anti-sigma-K factor RskA
MREHVFDLIPAYVLGSLDSSERRETEQHLKGCARCRRELEEYRQLESELAFAAPPADPSPQLRERVLQAVRGLDALSDTPPARAGLLRAFRAAPAWVAVMLLLLGLSILANVLLITSPGRPGRGTTHDVVLMSGTERAPQATAALVPGEDSRSATLLVEGLEQLAYGSQYQLWLIRDGQRTDGGVFSAPPTGRLVVEVSAPEPLASYGAFGVTIEPWGGSPGPTGPKVLGSSQ